MNKMKRFFSLLLMAALVLTLSVAAYAAGDGRITINNATKDETYKLYKVFDATTQGADENKSVLMPTPRPATATRCILRSLRTAARLRSLLRLRKTSTTSHSKPARPPLMSAHSLRRTRACSAPARK